MADIEEKEYETASDKLEAMMDGSYFEDSEDDTKSDNEDVKAEADTEELDGNDEDTDQNDDSTDADNDEIDTKDLNDGEGSDTERRGRF